ncbi:MAG TPA: TIGR00730 family Rossman fold protein [Rhizomicrobium sp.]|jgi:uncharacterized protein (TIGR00730 family)
MHNTSGRGKKAKSICVFAGSSPGRDEGHREIARDVGARIAKHGFSLVFGGGGLGLMGEVARAAREGGASVRGILPDFLRHAEPPPGSGVAVDFVPDLFTRKKRMMELSDAFVVLPGGLGTLDEFFEVVTTAQLGLHKAPIALINWRGFYDPLLQFVAQARDSGFVYGKVENLYRVVSSPVEAFEYLAPALR